MSELQSKLERRRSRIEAFSPLKHSAWSSDKLAHAVSEAGEDSSDPLAAYRDFFDVASADKETLLDLINICASMMHPETFNAILARHIEPSHSESS